MKKVALLSALILMLMVPKVFADDSVWESAKSPEYGKKFVGMLGRGLINIATCFVDLIQHTVEGTQDGPPFIGTMTGLGSGLGCTALRVSSGALDVLTFWVPGFNGMPVSKSYSNCLEEEETSGTAAYAAPAANTYQAPEPAAAAPAKHHHDPMDYVKK